jgi:hypothetical protein
MPTWLLWIVLGLPLVAAVVLGISAYGTRRWTTTEAVLSKQLDATRLDAAAHQPSLARVDFRELQGLSVPVQRYFRIALKDGQPIISALTVELTGTFNLSPTEERWKPFTSQQRID